MHRNRKYRTGTFGGSNLSRNPNGFGFLDHGYVRVNKGGCKFYLHRLIWEKFNGPITNGGVIHHINGVRSDNRIENLQLMSRGQHKALHNSKEAA